MSFTAYLQIWHFPQAEEKKSVFLWCPVNVSLLFCDAPDAPSLLPLHRGWEEDDQPANPQSSSPHCHLPSAQGLSLFWELSSHFSFTTSPPSGSSDICFPKYISARGISYSFK